MTIPRLAVAGVHGYGAWHVLHALDLQARGLVRLVALVDPLDGPIVHDGRSAPTALLPPQFPTLERAMDVAGPDVVVVATPLHTHADLTATALRAGADVLLEKPPVLTTGELDRLLDVERDCPGRVQVGFQARGSRALTTLSVAVRDGRLGVIHRLGVRGSWSRDRGYYARAPWAGRRSLDGRAVLDGTVTNPFAHAITDLLHVGGLTSAESIASVEVELLHAHDIEADDTAAVRIRPIPAAGRTSTSDCPLMAAFTLAGPTGPTDAPPLLEVVGDRATASLSYTLDRIDLSRNDGRTPPPDLAPLAGTYPRADLLEDLLARRLDGAELLSPLRDVAGFVVVAEAVARATPRPVDPRWVTWQGSGPRAAPVIHGIDRVLADVLDRQQLFSELGAPWAAESVPDVHPAP